MPVADLTDWLDTYSKPGTIWYLKRFSGNDTLANGSHQAGPYVPKDLLFRIFPAINRPAVENPDQQVQAYIDSHADHKQVRAIWYNNKLRGGTRNEARLTNWGGSSSAVLDPDSTGALAVFVFSTDSASPEIHAWVCNNPIEEDVVEDRVCPVLPGEHVIWEPEKGPLHLVASAAPAPCTLTAATMPPAWAKGFPSAAEIVAKAVELRPLHSSDADQRLLQRRDCEFQIFRSVEELLAMPRITAGFTDIADFLSFAQTMLQRRKARAGLSLELHARSILLEEHFIEGRTFDFKPESESKKEPDFLFPSEAAYKDLTFPVALLRMLAAKTTCKDRWRQITHEADRIDTKHLLTLQEGVSTNQYAEMKAAGVRLVVPGSLHAAYPKAVQPELLSLQDFIADVRLIAAKVAP